MTVNIFSAHTQTYSAHFIVPFFPNNVTKNGLAVFIILQLNFPVSNIEKYTRIAAETCFGGVTLVREMH